MGDQRVQSRRESHVLLGIRFVKMYVERHRKP